uniref:Uncharacterized protein n=2 Tax=Cucumis melo TaxID=3656 RepID=A0A9I9CFX8_CUCME
MEEILVNISEHIIAWVKHPCGARPFPHLIEKLCLKACSALDKHPQVEVKDRIWSSLTFHCIIVIHKNKSKLKCFKTKQYGKSEIKEVDDEDEEEEKEDDIPLKRKRQDKKEASNQRE